ncbi:MAG: efflux RND transporter permease subunit [Calditrichaeota bacterium]|nr:MAG: AcrB/AcrD/AcrF family protein [Calditrichota bacterium]MBL1207740.1 efflux RND transporter permease subunit [Calditrichota bacterium]NOG47574.1 efflux RND transporter permease subunit [Calditrichota bacterium]
MKSISEFSVKYPVTVLMLICAVGLLGLISFDRLSVDLFPDMNNPRIYIEVVSGELPPEELERKFIDNIEALVMRQRKVVSVASILRVGQAQITVEYDWDADMDEAFLDLQKNLAQFSQNSDIDELNLSQYDPNGAPVLLIGLSHDEITDMDALRRIGDNYIRNELIRLDGVAAVEVVGGQEKEVRIETQEQILDAFNLSIADVASQIQSANLDLTGGSIEELGKKYVIKGLGAFENLDEINKVVVTYKGGDEQGQNQIPVFLSDIGKVKYVNKDAQSIVKINGVRSVGLAVYKETKTNTVTAAETVIEALKVIKKALPGYKFSVISNQAKFISSAINEVEQSAIYGILLAVIILFVFLRRAGTTIIISLAIPISIVATFNLMYFNDLSLNIMTLGGLALGAGMLVDNAIVVMESIFRNLEEGLSLKEAAVKGTSQVSGAITASTITTIIVFLPIIYVQGPSAELFKAQAWTVAFSLIASLVVAILVIPMLSNWILKDKSTQSESIRFEGYKSFLEATLSKRKIVLGVAVIVVALTVLAAFYMKSEFIPKGKSESYSLEIKLPEGTNLDFTDKFVQGFEKSLASVIGDSLIEMYTQIGEMPSSVSGNTSESVQSENSAVLKIRFNQQNNAYAKRFTGFVTAYLDSFEQVEYLLKPEGSSLSVTLGTDVSAPLVVEIEGEEQEELKALAGQSLSVLKNLPVLRNIETSVQTGRPQVNLVIDRVVAGYNNLSIEQISSQLKELLGGQNSGSWEYQGELREINVNYPELSLTDLEQAYIYSGEKKIPLTDLANFNVIDSERELYRRNQKRIAWISADFDENYSLSEIVAQVQSELDKITFPPNYSFKITGEEEKRSESFATLKFALLLSIVLIYMVLASQFESLLHPFTIILTVPLAAVGAILIFFVLNMNLNVMAYIGIIMLMGIAVNDSIILVDAINRQRRNGVELIASIVEAGQQRIRPIIMTSLTTILALLPLTIGFGESAALRAPMAVAVIGGLISSTGLTLIVIPCVYYYMEKLRRA